LLPARWEQADLGKLTSWIDFKGAGQSDEIMLSSLSVPPVVLGSVCRLCQRALGS
jgi:hypothetical protein